MAIEVPQNEKISEGGKNGGRKGVGSTIRQRRANRGGALSVCSSLTDGRREMLTPTLSE